MQIEIKRKTNKNYKVINKQEVNDAELLLKIAEAYINRTDDTIITIKTKSESPIDENQAKLPFETLEETSLEPQTMAFSAGEIF